METEITKERNYNIDFLKGILMILVILGHVIPGALGKTFPRYLIYSFHMPVFIGISGYLIRVERLRDMKFSRLCGKYWGRVIVPWLLAVNVYFITVNWEKLFKKPKDADLLLSGYLEAYTRPYYHLWFVLGFLSYILITWLVLRMLRKDTRRALVVLFAAGLLLSVASRLDLFGNEAQEDDLWEGLQESLRLRNYIFFLLGMGIRHVQERFDKKSRNKIIRRGLLASAPLLAVTILYFYNPAGGARAAVYFLFNGALLTTLLFACMERKFPRCRPLEFIGVNSMAFYLWHVLGKNAVMDWIGNDAAGPWYFFNAVGVLLLAGLIYLGLKVKWIRRLVFGVR